MTRVAYLLVGDVPFASSCVISEGGEPLPGDSSLSSWIELWERDAPLSEDTFGIIAEVNTATTGTYARSQLVLGTVQQRRVWLLRDGHQIHEGLGAVQRVEQTVFVPYEQADASCTVYGDPELQCDIRQLRAGPAGHGRSFRRTYGIDDPCRLHQHQAPHRMRRKRDGEPNASGGTYSTMGDLLAIQTHQGVPLFPHMLVRLTGSIHYPHAIARSYLGQKTLFSPGERWNERGLCYQLLFRPRQGRG